MRMIEMKFVQSMPESSKWNLPFRLSYQNFVRIPQAIYMPRPSQTPWRDHPKSTNYEAPYCTVFSCLFIYFKSKHSPKHPGLEYPQSAFWTSHERPSFIPIQKERKQDATCNSSPFICGNFSGICPRLASLVGLFRRLHASRLFRITKSSKNITDFNVIFIFALNELYVWRTKIIIFKSSR